MEFDQATVEDVVGDVVLPAVSTTGARNAALTARKPRVDVFTTSLYCDGQPSARGLCEYGS